MEDLIFENLLMAITLGFDVELKISKDRLEMAHYKTEEWTASDGVKENRPRCLKIVVAKKRVSLGTFKELNKYYNEPEMQEMLHYLKGLVESTISTTSPISPKK